jgi:colanic acid/amylovoran biosynthesis protein
LYKVILMGTSLDTGNMGVSALASSLIKLIFQIRLDTNVSFFIANRSSEPQYLDAPDGQIKINIINYRFSPKAQFSKNLLWIFIIACLQYLIPFNPLKKMLIKSSPQLNALYNSDFIGDIHGGDSFSDIYGLQRFIMGTLPDIIILLLRKRLILLPQTYGPYTSFLSQKIARYIFKRATCIISRDKEGAEVVKKIIGAESKGINIHFCPDVAFLLDAARSGKTDIEPPLISNTDLPLIGLNVNGLLYNGGYTGGNMFGLKYEYKIFIHNLVKRLMMDTDAHILLIPHTFAPKGHVESDPDACREIFGSIEDSYKNRVHLVMGEHDQFAIKGIIGLCDFFIGSRMHACIAALSQGIPTVGVAYSRKFAGVFESVGFGSMVSDARSVDMQTAIEDICMLFQNREQLTTTLKTNIEAAKKQLVDTFAKILK